MSCVTVIGRRRQVQADCDDRLPHSAPVWTKSKARRLEAFGWDPRAKYRAVAAAHPRLDTVLQHRLAQDEDYGVRSALVRNPALEERVVHLLRVDVDPGIRAYAALRLVN